ncbi:hypothetical protein FOZ61_007277 [Perkinsus olseni]|uniref:Aminotransferase class I/classII large domain-containing protein n=1 Tax=Perkinsus olseni TaxID=32597 RepID=A0A7J6L9X5_PEROL|nr:hypothetical protein FOZ61_007277 [Perkinsus olseni]
MNVPRQRDWKLIETVRDAAFKHYSGFSMVSPVAQEVCARMLNDEQWLAGFLQISRERLTSCKRILCDGLGKLNIPYFEPHAGLFLWCDLTEFIEPDDQDGLGLFNKLKSDPYRMVVSPGSSFFADKPGMMRFCYAWMSDGEEAWQICPAAAAAAVSPVLHRFTMTTIFSIIGLERFFAALFALSVFLTAILAGLDFAVTEAILGLSLVAVQRMFVQSETREDSVDARPTPTQLPAVCQRPRVSRLKKRGKTVGLETVGVTCAGIEPATASVACLPERVDRSVGTEDLPGLYECVDPVPTKQLSRAARRRQRRRERLHAASELGHDITEPCKGKGGALDGGGPSKVDEGYAPTPSTDLSVEEDKPSDESHARLAEVDTLTEQLLISEVGDGLDTDVTQEVSQGPPTPKGYIPAASHASSTSASYDARHKCMVGPPVGPPPYPPPEYQYVDPSQWHQAGYVFPWMPIPFPELATRVRWVGEGELRIEMAGVWAGTKGKWKLVAISHWLKWLNDSYIEAWECPPLLDLDLSRNDLTDEEFVWIVEELDKSAAILRLRASYNQLTERCADTLARLFDISRQPITEFHLNGNYLGDEGVSAILTAATTTSRHRKASAIEGPPLWLRVDDNAVDHERELLSSIFRPGEYCGARTRGGSCTLETCAKGALIHLFNFAREKQQPPADSAL